MTFSVQQFKPLFSSSPAEYLDKYLTSYPAAEETNCHYTCEEIASTTEVLSHNKSHLNSLYIISTIHYVALAALAICALSFLSLSPLLITGLAVFSAAVIGSTLCTIAQSNHLHNIHRTVEKKLEEIVTFLNQEPPETLLSFALKLGDEKRILILAPQIDPFSTLAQNLKCHTLERINSGIGYPSPLQRFLKTQTPEITISAEPKPEAHFSLKESTALPRLLSTIKSYQKQLTTLTLENLSLERLTPSLLPPCDTLRLIDCKDYPLAVNLSGMAVKTLEIHASSNPKNAQSFFNKLHVDVAMNTDSFMVTNRSKVVLTTQEGTQESQLSRTVATPVKPTGHRPSPLRSRTQYQIGQN